MNILHLAKRYRDSIRFPSLRTSLIVGAAGLAAALYMWATWTSGANLYERLPFPLLFLALGIYELVSRKQSLNRSKLIGWLLVGLTLFLLGVKLFKAWHAGWNAGPTGWYSVAGFLPIDDAVRLYEGSRNLLEHGFLDELSAFRPMVANYYALLLLVTGQNLLALLAVNGLLLALSIAMFSRWIYARFGLLAALLALLLEAYFIMPFAPTTMTEIPGFCFGNFAFLLLAQGAYGRQKRSYLLGLGLLSLALMFRAGAMFALPALALAGGWLFAGCQKYSMRFVVIGVGVLSLPVLLNTVELRVAGPPGGGMLYGEFSSSLYGIVQGNKGWDYYKTAHPELMELGHSQRNQIVYDLVRQELKKRPFALVDALARGYAAALKNPFGRLYPNLFPMSLCPFLIPFIYFFVGLGLEKNENWRRLSVVLCAATAGIFLSLPFLADVGYRVLAATVPITSGVLAMGLKSTTNRLRIVEGDAPADLSVVWLVRGAAFFPLVLLAAMLCMPMAGKIHRAHWGANYARIDVPPGTVPLRIYKGALLHVSPDDAPSRAAQIRWSDFQRYGFEDQAIRSIRPGEWLASGVVNLQEGARYYRFVIFEEFPPRNGVAYCRLTPVEGSQRVFRAQVVRYADDAQ